MYSIVGTGWQYWTEVSTTSSQNVIFHTVNSLKSNSSIICVSVRTDSSVARPKGCGLQNSCCINSHEHIIQDLHTLCFLTVTLATASWGGGTSDRAICDYSNTFQWENTLPSLEKEIGTSIEDNVPCPPISDTAEQYSLVGKLLLKTHVKGAKT